MNGILDAILHVNPVLAYVLVGGLVFAEDAIFVGFVLPGETAAVLGGVLASRGRIELWLVVLVVVVAAIVGDTVGYEIGKRLGPRVLNLRVMSRRRDRLDKAQDLLRRRGGVAVFFGRFVAFFRAVMPALAGSSRMPYPTFLAFNAAGGLVWGVGFVVLGYLAGNSYQAISQTVGTDVAVAVALFALVTLVIWQIRKGVIERKRRRDAAR